jgi:hypothetical protein
VGLTLASDTLSITTMEIVDNAFILIVPGAIDAGLGDALFWWSLGLSLVIAFNAAFPVNRVLIARGRGHASCTSTTSPAPPGASSEAERLQDQAANRDHDDAGGDRQDAGERAFVDRPVVDRARPLLERVGG